MLNSLSEINKLLTGTELENSSKVVLDIPKSSECAFAIKVKAENCLRAWAILRALLDATQRYPVLVGNGVFASDAWGENVVEENLFSRQEFTYEYSNFFEEDINLSPEAIVTRAKAIDIVQEIQRIPQEKSWFSLVEAVGIELGYTLERFGIAPQEETVLNSFLDNPINASLAIERWLFDWEREHLAPEVALAPPDPSYLYLDWYSPRSTDLDYTLVLLPTPRSWEAIAYIHWFGAESSEKMIALLQSWHERFNAELVAHDRLNLLFNVHHRPTTPEAAFQLAVEQEFFAGATLNLPGISVRDHARALLHIDRWCLVSKP